MRMSLLELKNVSMIYNGKVKALENINLNDLTEEENIKFYIGI